MPFRYARHTDDINAIVAFYQQLVGLDRLGDFRDHQGYDGVFLGLPDADWHLEFTHSAEPAVHTPDDDDLLVFYARSDAEYTDTLQRFSDAGVCPVPPRNPYWTLHGVTFRDPDGFRIVIAGPRD